MRGIGFIILVAVAVPVWTPATTAGQLPNCTITFDDTCPDVTPECGATFVGGDGCQVIGVANCYSSGVFSYQVADGGGVTITLSDDLNSVSVFFAHQVADGAGTMTFLSATEQQVDDPLLSDGPCDGPMPPTRVLFFSQPVRSIEVANTGVGNLWIDTFEVNPPCGDSGDCDDGDDCTTDACDGGACTQTPLDCDDGIACTDDACVAGACVSTPNDSNCPDDGEFCNGIENCDPLSGCVSSGDACQAGQFCNEATETCGDCIADGDCDDDDACTEDSCDSDFACVSTPIVCPDGEVCDPEAGKCTSECGDCPWDVGPPGPNLNVGPEDLAFLLGSWGPIPPDADAEVQCLDIGPPGPNGQIGPEDLALLLGSWGPCPSSNPPECQNDADCDDGVFCNGEEVCDSENGMCIEGSEPCSGLFCAEESASCVECLSAADCNDQLFCNGSETCAESVCQPGIDPCSTNETCNEVDDSCEPGVTDQDNQNDNGDGDDGDPTAPDDDGDGIPNVADQCPETASGVSVDSAGCSESQTNGDDNGGMTDDEEMDSNGCGTGSCGAAGSMGLAWILAALSAARVARRRGWPS